MNSPVIDPQTLTEEQREKIREKYKSSKIACEVFHFETHDKMNVLEWLFGKSMFEKQ